MIPVPYKVIELICDADMGIRYDNMFRKITVKEVLELYEIHKDRIEGVDAK